MSCVSVVSNDNTATWPALSSRTASLVETGSILNVLKVRSLRVAFVTVIWLCAIFHPCRSCSVGGMLLHLRTPGLRQYATSAGRTSRTAECKLLKRSTGGASCSRLLQLMPTIRSTRDVCCSGRWQDAICDIFSPVLYTYCSIFLFSAAGPSSELSGLSRTPSYFGISSAHQCPWTARHGGYRVCSRSRERTGSIFDCRQKQPGQQHWVLQSVHSGGSCSSNLCR